MVYFSRDRRDQRRIGSGRIQIDRDQGRDRERDYHRYDRDDRDRGDRDRDRVDRDRDLHDRDRDRNRMDRDRDRRYVVERSDRFRRGDNRDFGDRMAERVSGISVIKTYISADSQMALLEVELSLNGLMGFKIHECVYAFCLCVYFSPVHS